LLSSFEEAARYSGFFTIGDERDGCGARRLPMLTAPFCWLYARYKGLLGFPGKFDEFQT
jgi:hypothetical protein